MRRVKVILMVAGSLLLAACHPDLSRSLSATIQTKATSENTGTRAAERAIPATVLMGDTVPYEIVAAGDPAVGSGQNTATAAWRPGETTPEALAVFPDEAHAALASLRTPAGSDLYLAIYGGVQPSSGYEVKISAVTQQDNRLQVTYQVAGPPPGQGAATVLTHPYVIARVADTTTAPTAVVFVEQPIVR
jgi:hypothetical protein